MAKKPKPKICIVPTAGVLAETLQRLHELSDHSEFTNLREHLSGKLPAIREQTLVPLVAACFLDEIQSRTVWTKLVTRIDPIEDALNKLIPGYEHNYDPDMRDRVYCEIVDEIWLHAIATLTELVNVEKTWDVFYVTILGRDIMIERGEDFRVLDWMARTNIDLEAQQQALEDTNPEWELNDEFRHRTQMLLKEQKELAGDPASARRSPALRLEKQSKRFPSYRRKHGGSL